MLAGTVVAGAVMFPVVMVRCNPAQIMCRRPHDVIADVVGGSSRGYRVAPTVRCIPTPRVVRQRWVICHASRRAAIIAANVAGFNAFMVRCNPAHKKCRRSHDFVLDLAGGSSRGYKVAPSVRCIPTSRVIRRR